MKTYLLAVFSIFISVAAQAGHHEAEEMQSAAVIGTVYSDDGTANKLLAGNTDKQQIWVDYIQAHNDRNLDGIATVKADDWEANNYSLVEDNNNVKVNNPGGYDALMFLVL